MILQQLQSIESTVAVSADAPGVFNPGRSFFARQRRRFTKKSGQAGTQEIKIRLTVGLKSNMFIR